MKKVLSLVTASLLLLALVSLAVMPASAAEYELLFEDKFDSDASLANYTPYNGAWKVIDGVLTVEKGEGDFSWAHIMYNSAEKIGDCKIEYDFLNHTAGGVVVNCNDVIEGNNSWNGYYFACSNDGTKVFYGIAVNNTYNMNDNSGNIFVSTPVLTALDDVHCVLEVTGNDYVFTVYNLADGAELYAVNYTESTYNLDDGYVGLRLPIVNNLGTGSFDNFKVYKSTGAAAPAGTTAAPTADTTAAPTADTTAASAVTTAAAAETAAPFTGDTGVLTYVIIAVSAVVVLGAVMMITKRKGNKN